MGCPYFQIRFDLAVGVPSIYKQNSSRHLPVEAHILCEAAMHADARFYLCYLDITSEAYCFWWQCGHAWRRVSHLYAPRIHCMHTAPSQRKHEGRTSFI